MDRRRSLLEGTDLPTRCHGAALFADVSGFSALASQLSDELGPRRAPEALLERINPVLASLVQIVQRHLGTVVSFAGDSITCWFDDEPHVEDRRYVGARRALACALAMQASLDAEVSFGDPSLKVGIAAGPARRMLVGDPDILQIDTLAGATLVRMARAERAARPGEIIVSSEVLAPARATQTTGRRVDAPGEAYFAVRGQLDPPEETSWPGLPARVDERRHLGWIPRALLGQIERPGAIAELRAVVPLFAAFDDIDYDSDDAAPTRLDALVRWAQRTLHRSEGSLLQLSIGDKGSYFYGTVGAPTAVPDAPRVAASVAMELSRPPSALASGPLRIGLSYGRAWTGIVGADARRCYAVMGDDVNLAARLMQRADRGEVLATRELAVGANGFRFDSIGQIAIKGKNRTIPVHRLIGRKEVKDLDEEPSSTRLVGRETELREVDALLPRAGSEPARVCVIEGQAGMGKTRLAREIVARARASGMRVFTSAGDTVERDTPLRCWRTIFYSLFDLADDTATSTLEERVAERARAVDPAIEADGRLPLLNTLLQTRFPETELTRWISDEVRADNTRETCVRLLALLLGRSSTVILLDDADWIDSASWALLRRLWQEQLGVLALVMRRPSTPGERSLGKEYEELAAASSTVHFTLQSLGDDETLDLVRARLGVAALPERLSDFVSTRAAGHPLLADQLTAALRESGHIRVEAGRCSLAPRFDESAFELPGSVEGVIAARLDRLDAGDQQLLKVASVLGATFDEDGLAALLRHGEGGPNPQGETAGLERLVDAGFLSRRPDGCSFRHALVRDVIYERLLFAQRRSLHRAAAQYLEGRYAADLSPWHALLAHHYTRAGANGEAAVHLGHAGEVALRAGAFRETAVFLERALDLAPAGVEPTKRAQWQRRLASAHYRLGNLPRSTEAAESAVGVFDRPIPKQGIALVKGVLAELGGQFRNRFRPLSATTPAHGDVAANLRSAVHIYQNLSEVYYLGGLQGPSIYAALRQVNVAERAGVSEELAEAYAVLSIIASLVGMRGVSNRYETLAAGVVDQLENPRARAMLKHQRSLKNAASGDFDRVRLDERAAIATFDRLGDIGRKRDAMGLLGTTEYLASRFDDAERVLSDLLATRTGNDRFVQEIWGSAWLGGVALVRGDLPDATERFERSIALLDRNTVGLMEISCVGFLGLSRLRSGDDAGARAAIDKAYTLLEKARGRPTGHISLDGYSAVAECYLHWFEHGRDKVDGERAKQACKWLRGFAKSFPIGEPAAELFAGRLHVLQGRSEEGRLAWERGLSSARRLSMSCEEGRLLLALAGSATEQASAQKERLARSALERFESIGARYYATFARALCP
ncbi:MAG: AAA family ATPase [Polyangiaceae bacterium]|nr:AAA family ATPase [Polyangiaceae bacterium]